MNDENKFRNLDENLSILKRNPTEINDFNSDPINMNLSDEFGSLQITDTYIKKDDIKFDVHKFFNILKKIEEKNKLTGINHDYMRDLFIEYFNSLKDEDKEKLINGTLDSEYEDKSFNYLRPSEISECEYKIFFFKTQAEKDSSFDVKYPYSMMMRDTGTFLHAYIQLLYKFDKTEVPFYDEEYKVKGRIDGIIDNTIIEIKTVKSFDYQQSHVNQALLYSYFLNKTGEYDIKDFEIVMLNRNLKEFQVNKYYLSDLDDDLNGLLEKIKKLNYSIENKNSFLLKKDKNSCIFCQFKNICNKMKEVKIMDIKK